MRIQTLSIVVGGKACNAKCPYCVAKLTGFDEIKSDEPINKRNLQKACQLAKDSRVTTVLLTSKGEPLLYLKEITEILQIISKYNFPFIELQTNGIQLPKISSLLFKQWYDLGLSTVSLSCVSYYPKLNGEIFGDEWHTLSDYIGILHSNNFSVRLSCVMIKGYTDSVESIVDFLNYCKINNVEQTTFRPVINISNVGLNKEKQEIYNWVKEHKVPKENMEFISKYFNNSEYSQLLLNLAHGAKVYDYKGQNICLSNCLTESTNLDDIRQIIYYSSGRLMYSWVYSGAILL